MNENYKRIAKNTLMLYFRMLLIMGVSLYTVRVVLKMLGVIDYGINNVVGGIVVMFSFFANTMAAASQRFFAFELGRKDYVQLKRTFSLTITIYVVLGIIILILAETIGLWFINNKLVIPNNRLSAANWVYQFSILSFLATMITVPYEAAIIAHENMNVYAYVSILEAGLKLLIVYLLVYFSFDKLKLYAIFLFLTTFIITFIYRTFCIRKYEECRFKFYWNKELFNTLLGYSGWNLFGALAGIMNNQGINILLNIFFGPAVNAARAIAYQASNAINQFVSNFITAVRPQITKHYAAGEKDEMIKLVFQSAKFSYYLLFFLSLPILLETEFIIKTWLNETPEFVILFTRLLIINALIDSLSYPLMSAAQATGDIKKYQSFVGGAMLLNIPISYLSFCLGFSPEYTFYISITISILCLFLRLGMLKKMIDLSIVRFINDIVMAICIVSIIAFILPITINFFISYGMLRFFFVGSIGGLSTTTAIYFFGLNSSERSMIKLIGKKYSKNFFKK